MKPSETRVEKVLFASRSILVLFNLGLVLVLVMLLFTFGNEFIHFFPLVLNGQVADVF